MYPALPYPLQFHDITSLDVLFGSFWGMLLPAFSAVDALTDYQVTW